MKYLITESKMVNVVHKVLTSEFEGFMDMDYDWAEYNCGMGVCCDPYAIGFVLPTSEYYYNYLFKLVDSKYYDDDGDYPRELSDELPEPCLEPPTIENLKESRFDTIVVPYETAEILDEYFNSPELWVNEFLTIINTMYNVNAKEVLIL